MRYYNQSDHDYKYMLQTYTEAEKQKETTEQARDIYKMIQDLTIKIRNLQIEVHLYDQLAAIEGWETLAQKPEIQALTHLAYQLEAMLLWTNRREQNTQEQ